MEPTRKGGGLEVYGKQGIRHVVRLCSIRRPFLVIQILVLVILLANLFLVKHTPALEVNEEVIDSPVLESAFPVAEEEEREAALVGLKRLVGELASVDPNLKLFYAPKPISAKGSSCPTTSPIAKELDRWLKTKEGAKHRTKKDEHAHVYVYNVVLCRRGDGLEAEAKGLLAALSQLKKTAEWKRSGGADHVFLMPDLSESSINGAINNFFSEFRKQNPSSVALFTTVRKSSAWYDMWRDIVAPSDLVPVLTKIQGSPFSGESDDGNLRAHMVWVMGVGEKPDYVTSPEWEAWNSIGQNLPGAHTSWQSEERLLQTSKSTFCICLDPSSVYISVFSGCIPVFLASEPALAFEDILDYSPFLLRFPISHMPVLAIYDKGYLVQMLMRMLEGYPEDSILSARKAMETVRGVLSYASGTAKLGHGGSPGLALDAVLMSLKARRAQMFVEGDIHDTPDLGDTSPNKEGDGGIKSGSDRAVVPEQPIKNAQNVPSSNETLPTNLSREIALFDGTVTVRSDWPIFEDGEMGEFSIRLIPPNPSFEDNLPKVLPYDYLEGNNVYSLRVSPHDVLEFGKDAEGVGEEYELVKGAVRERTVDFYAGKKDTSVQPSDVIEPIYALTRFDWVKGSEYIVHYDVTLGGIQTRHEAQMKRYLNTSQPSISVHPISDRYTKINIVVALKGRGRIFVRFLQTYLNLLKADQDIHFFLVYNSPDGGALAIPQIEKLAGRTLGANWKNVMTIIGRTGNFSRALSLAEGIQRVPRGEIAFLSDVDLNIHSQFLNHCRYITVRGQRIYFPIFYSLQPRAERLRMDRGYYRTDGYGAACLYPDDFDAVGGFNSSWENVSWGREAPDLYARFAQNSSYQVVRAYDPHLLHNWHPQLCSSEVDAEMYRACVDTLFRSLGSQRRLSEVIYKYEPTAKDQQGYVEVIQQAVRDIEAQSDAGTLDGRNLAWRAREKAKAKQKS
eukprot:comp19996_c0_seq1/m.24468 comp19996_c0_seq1/g.24468  ORF comp19996_c0_seq1/g.24468 comp19996_c0_seq1/m.24468 type:complete len:958 (-) comp19996_c0_seq1:263-3136(-)